MTAQRRRSPDHRTGDRHLRAPRRVRLPEDVDAALLARAAVMGRPVGACITEAVRAWLVAQGMPAVSVVGYVRVPLQDAAKEEKATPPKRIP